MKHKVEGVLENVRIARNNILSEGGLHLKQMCLKRSVLLYVESIVN